MTRIVHKYYEKEIGCTYRSLPGVQFVTFSFSRKQLIKIVIFQYSPT